MRPPQQKEHSENTNSGIPNDTNELSSLDFKVAGCREWKGAVNKEQDFTASMIHNPLRSWHIEEKEPPLELSDLLKFGPELPQKREHPRPWGLSEAPTFYPTTKQFAGNPLSYIEKIVKDHGAAASGICKIVPPSGWHPKTSLDFDVSILHEQ